MADGNIGSLWLSLGIRDAVSKELNRIADGMTGVDAKTKKAQESLRKLAEENPAGKNVAFLDKLKKAVGDSTKEAKELQAVFEAIRSMRGGFGALTMPSDKKALNEYYGIIEKIYDALGKLYTRGLSVSGDKMHGNALGALETIKGVWKIRDEMDFFFDNLFKTDKAKAGLQDIQKEIGRLMKEGMDFFHKGGFDPNGLNWAAGLEKQINKLYKAYGTLREEEEKQLASSEKKASTEKQNEERTRRSADASREKTEALKREETALNNATAAQEKKNEADSKAAVAPKGQPFVADKGIEKMLSDATRVTEKVEEQKKSLSGLSDAASKASRDVNEVLNKIVGGNAAGMSLDELAKKTARYSQELLELEAKLKHLKSNAEANPGKKGPDYSEVKSLEAKIKNAQIYLDIIQQIRFKKDELNATGAKQPNVNTKELERGKALLDEFYGTLRKIVSEKGVDGLMVLGNMPKALGGTMREIRSLLSSFSKENPLSVFANGADRAWTAISNLETKMRDLQRLMDEGKKMGYKTDMLPENFYELKRRLQEAYRLFGDNSHRLTDKAYMENLFSDIAKTMKIAANAEHEYGKEKGKTIATNKEAAVVEKAVNQEIANEHKAAQQERERDLQALSDYTKRYMELQEAKRKADDKAAKDAKDKARRQSEAEQRRIASDTAKMSRLYASMGLGIGKGERVGMRGLELGVNTAALDKALSEAAKFKKTIENTVVSMMGKGDRPAYEWYAAQVNRLKENLTNATAAQKELNAAQEKANRKAESDDAKRRADEKRREAQAARELAQAEKQRQNQLEVTRARIQSVERALHNLQEKRFTAKMLGIDTSEANAKIEHLKTQLIGLRNIQLGLSMGDTSFLGRVGNLGNGREVQAANQLSGTYSRLIGEVEKTNREKEKSIELERAHQQEVARTAAKVRGDLAAAFAGANAEAGNMRGVLDDVKSLLLQGGIVYGAKQFFDSVVKTGGEIAQQHIALRSILGDAAKADELFEQTQQLALRSPFKFGELNRDVKQLAAFGVEADDLYNTAKRLADIASGLGVSFERLGLAYGQVKARSWLDGKELRQFAYAGLPLLARITELYNS